MKILKVGIQMKVTNFLVSILVCLTLTAILSPVVVGENYAELREGGEIKLYLGSTPLSNSYHAIKGGSKVRVIDKKEFDLPADSDKNGYWVKIEFSEEQLVNYNSWLLEERDGQAWIPDWYVSPEDSKPIKEPSQGLGPFVLNRENPTYIYPGGPEIGDLFDHDYYDRYEKGKLLRPQYRWEDWYLVDIIVYSIPSVLEGWFHRKDLSSVEEVDPIEGYLPEGTEIFSKYEDIEEKEARNTRKNWTVRFDKNRNGYVRVSAHGGWSAWTRKDNIVYDRDELE